MCGIVGYIGDRSTKDILISGLKTLEYRGYDSAGICIIENGDFVRIRAAGKIEELEKKSKQMQFSGSTGIAHTRWATHGPAVERNAHPHAVGNISIVHNGIIENYLDIKDKLVKLGAKIESDTDSELVAHLMNNLMNEGKSLIESAFACRRMLEGAFSILVLDKRSDGELVAFKNGPPLLVGKNQVDNHNEYIIASDIQAILPYSKTVGYLQDGDLVHIKDMSLQFYDVNDQPLERQFETIEWDAESTDKKGFEYYMLKEIFEQPNAVSMALAPHIASESRTVQMSGFFEDEKQTEEYLAGLEQIYLVACGTSYYAAMYAEYVLEKLALIPTEVDIASEFRYRNPILNPNSLVIFVSQSGETADTLAALRLVKSQGVKTLSICNTKKSSIDRESDFSLYMNSGPEIGVASTKAFTSTLSILAALGIAFGRAKKRLSLEQEVEYTTSLLSLPLKLENVLAYDTFFKETSETLKGHKGFLYMGRGTNYPIAMEGALKLKELAYMHAEGYAAGEMKHGPLALIDEQMMIVMLAPQDDLYEKTISNLEEARARGGKIISLGDVGDSRLETMSDHFLGLPKADWLTYPILETVPLQLMAYHVAKSLGYDVDQPRNLAKSVTVE